MALEADAELADPTHDVSEWQNTKREAPSDGSETESHAVDETEPLSDEEKTFLDFLVREAISSLPKAR